jgi:hypothetical protein
VRGGRRATGAFPIAPHAAHAASHPMHTGWSRVATCQPLRRACRPATALDRTRRPAPCASWCICGASRPGATQVETLCDILAGRAKQGLGHYTVRRGRCRLEPPTAGGQRQPAEGSVLPRRARRPPARPLPRSHMPPSSPSRAPPTPRPPPRATLGTRPAASPARPQRRDEQPRCAQ